ncbi:MAG: histidine kinase [Burkholderiales bacterium]|nr:histidine kinase [Burkholderiales bacterium]
MPSALQTAAGPGRVAAAAAALRRRLPRDAAFVALLNTAIAALLTVGGGTGFLANFVYSQVIGFALLLLIDGGRLVLWPGRSPPVGPMAALVALAVPVGVAGGAAVARAILGEHVAPPAQALWTALAVAFAAAAAATYFFWTRERAGHLEAEAALGRARAAELERLAAEARFRQLAAQVEPHFLFNTLANLRALVETDPPRAVTMLDHLDGYLRASLAAARAARVPLGDECALVADYLAILAIRMGPRLAWRIDLPDDCAAAAVPPMLLQPLVENAVKHGLEPSAAGGTVTVRARREGATVVVDVADTGLGLDRARAARAGFGVASVRERLAATYGDAASLELGPGAGGGTLATVRFPLERA